MQIVIDRTGPLPITQKFNSDIQGPATFILTGSVWSQTANTNIGVQLLLDGVELGEAEIFSNGVSTHRAVVPQYLNANLKVGEHTLTLEASTTQTLSDINDTYRVVVAT